VAVYETFQYGVAAGVGALACTVAFAVATTLYAVRRLTLRTVLDNADGYETSDPRLPELVGSEGVTVTQLRPSGYCRIDGRRIGVVTRGEAVDAERRVEVIEIEGSRVVVKEL